MKPLYLLVAFAALTFSACESRQEEAREDALEKKADTLEDQAEATREQK